MLFRGEFWLWLKSKKMPKEPLIFLLAPIAAASFCEAQRSKRYSEKREIASKIQKNARLTANKKG